jgi:hypothetical protein
LPCQRQARDPAARPGHQGDQARVRHRCARRPLREGSRGGLRPSASASRFRTRKSRSWRATPCRSRSTTAARWTSSGAATAWTASSTSCRRAPRR